MEAKFFRSYKYKQVDLSINSNLDSISIPIDCGSWKRPHNISLNSLKGVLQIKLKDDLAERNVTSVEYVNQEENPELPPNTFKVNNRTHIAVDDNYMYVWISNQSKWKRFLLSDW